MRTVTRDEILGLGAYEEVRERFRARMIAHKKLRRVFVGDDVTMVFEDHDTVLLQVQEMLRAERISAPDAVQAEIDVYNDLVAPDGALRATMMIEIDDPERRESQRRAYAGIDDCVWFELGDARVQGSFDPIGRYEDRTAVVRYVTFALPPDARTTLRDAAKPARVVIEHPKYQATTVLSAETRASLAGDL